MPVPADAKRVFLIVALIVAGVLLAVEGISLGFDFGKVADKIMGATNSVSDDGYRLACEAEGCNTTNCSSKCDLEPEHLDIQTDYKATGLGIPADALMSLWLFIAVALILAGTLPKKGLIPVITGVVNLIAGIIILILSIVVIFGALAKLLFMLGLLMAFPFGPLIYLALFGWFARGAAATTLGFALLAKAATGILLVVGNRTMLKVPSMVILILCTILCGIIVTFLHAFVPIFLVSITDSVAAIIVGIIVLIWSIFFLIGGIVQLVAAAVAASRVRVPG